MDDLMIPVEGAGGLRQVFQLFYTFGSKEISRFAVFTFVTVGCVAQW